MLELIEAGRLASDKTTVPGFAETLANLNSDARATISSFTCPQNAGMSTFGSRGE